MKDFGVFVTVRVKLIIAMMGRGPNLRNPWRFRIYSALLVVSDYYPWLKRVSHG